MTVNVKIQGTGDGGQLYDGDLLTNPSRKQLITASEAMLNTRFKAVSVSASSITVIASAPSNGALALTDLIITSDKTNATSVSVRFNDGTNQVVIAEGDSTNAPISLAIGFTGLWVGWKDANLELRTVGAVKANAAVGYMKIEEGESFAVWDSSR